jgi:Fe(3+) dicitrate transport protein
MLAHFTPRFRSSIRQGATFFFLLSVSLFAPVAATAQATSGAASETTASVRVVGQVSVVPGQVPASGVRVQVEGSPNATYTDAQGGFVLAGLEDRAPVRLTFTRLGLAAQTLEVTPVRGANIRVDVAMRVDAVALAPVDVLFERTRMVGDPLRSGGVPASAFHLGPQELRGARLAFDNVHDILRTVPGVIVEDEEGYGLRPNIGLRGATSERSSRITLMEDGILIAPAPYAAPAAYFFPATGRMEGVEVQKGSSQFRSGPRTLGGSINLLSAGIPQKSSWLAEIGGGTEGAMRTHLRLGDRGRHYGWMVEGLQARTDGFKELQTGGNTGFLTQDFHGRFRINTDGSQPRYQELELKVGLNDHRSDETYLGLTEADMRARPNLRYAASAEDVINSDHTQLRLRYFATLSAKTDVTLALYRHDFSRNWYKLQSVLGRGLAGVLSEPDRFATEVAILKGAPSSDGALRVRANNRTYRSEGIQGQVGYRWDQTFGRQQVAHALELGLRLHRDYEDRFQWEDGYAMGPTGRMVQTSQGAPGSQDNRRGSAEALSFHLQDQIRAGRFTLIPGVRYEDIQFQRHIWPREDADRRQAPGEADSRVRVWVPGVGATWEWTPRLLWDVGLHRGFGPPGPGASEDTQAETALNLETGLRLRHPLVGLNLVGWYSDYSNLLGQATLSTGDTGSGDLFNGGKAKLGGVEMALDADLARLAPQMSLRLPLQATYGWNQGTFGSDFVSAYAPWGTVTSGDHLPFLPSHTFAGSLGVDDGIRLVTLSWNGASQTRSSAGRGPIPSGEGSDAFVVFNLKGEWRAFGGTVQAGVQNLADREYAVSRRPAGARPGLPRSVFVGFRVGTW